MNDDVQLVSKPTWILMPVMVGEAMTLDALSDCLAQSVPVRILLILQGIDPDWRDRLEQIAEEEPRLVLWAHDPPLPSLSATWNRALDFVWKVGGTEALVVNNDVRLHVETARVLSTVRIRMTALFISAVGVTAEQFAAFAPLTQPAVNEAVWNVPGEDLGDVGGPDFSCFLISRDCHAKYRFDEGFTPAFCEDLDLHRRMMLGGDGERIFSINLPFLHLSSQTIKQMDEARRQRLNHAIEQGSRRHYAAKWGGSVNHERWTIPFDAASDQDGVTTPELQRLVQASPNALVDLVDPELDARLDGRLDTDAAG